MSTSTFSEKTFQPEKLSRKSKGHTVEIEVLPNLGANLSSFKVDGQQLIYFSQDRLLKDNSFYTGCFMMFPTPCRITGCQYPFQDRLIKQAKHGKDIFIHGLVRDEPFTVSRGDDSLLCSIAIDKGHPSFEGYPFPCRFSLKFTLLERGLEVSFKYENTGATDAPFGFGMHPFWLIPGKREDFFIRVPCDYVLEAVNLIPTGNPLPVAGTPLDLRQFRCLAELNIDNAFWGRDVSSTQAIQYRDLSRQLTFHSSDIFTHMIAYLPPKEPFACVEQLTCSPDAPNVYAKGKKETSGLRIVKPGQSLEGSVKFVVTDI